jgi:hypothetical protein
MYWIDKCMKWLFNEVMRLTKGIILGAACIIALMFAISSKPVLQASKNHAIPPVGVLTSPESDMPLGQYLTEEKALSIVEIYVEKLNPGVRVGRLSDAGRYFKVNIFSKDNVVVKRLIVEKSTGRLKEQQ